MITIYEPAMCCATGLCGPSVNPELLRISTVISNLQKKGIKVQRYNLSSSPQAFVANQSINKLVAQQGPQSLPATVIDGQIVKTKAYPTNAELAGWLDVPIQDIEGTKMGAEGCDCGPGGCC